MTQSHSTGEEAWLRRLQERLGEKHVAERLHIERGHGKRTVMLGRFPVTQGFTDGLMAAIERALKLSGLWKRGRANALSYRVSENKFRFPNLPSSFRGYRILHLSDLHIEEIHDDCERLKRILSGIRADACVMTGDFRFEVRGDSTRAMECIRRLLAGLYYKDGIYAVLGNHDTLEMVPAFERLGVQVLMNESLEIERGASRIGLAGTDDPHYFRLHDVKKAVSALEPERFKILLAHSPDITQEAAQAGISLYLCGHSHGGQICLPGGIPIVANMKCPRRYYSGLWRVGGMHGYTSSGTGASGVPVRFFSRPEIAIHELH